MKRISLLVFCSIFTLNFSYSQEYVELMQNKDANFYDVQKSFNKYWEGKEYEKGLGWKQFKRWEYFMEPRVFPHGKIIDPSITFKEHKKFQNQYALPKGSIRNKNSNWTPIGPTSFSDNDDTYLRLGRVNAITIDPNNSNIIYAGTPAGGCWKSIDGGNSWDPISDDLLTLGVSGIVVDPNNSNIIYIATGDYGADNTYSIGVLKSTDAGATWQNTGLNWSTSQFYITRRLLIHPTNSNVLWVASKEGIFKTTNAGNSWNKVASGNFRDIELNPLNPNTLYACTSNAAYKSTNAGDSFEQSSGIPSFGIQRLSLAVTENDTNYVYVLAVRSGDAGFEGLYRSTDGGENFTIRTKTPNILSSSLTGNANGGQGWYDLALAVSPTNKNEIYTGGVNIWKSTDGGSTLFCITNHLNPNDPTKGFTHADIHTLDFFGNTLFCGSDGGIYKTNNKGVSWEDLTDGIQNSQYYRLGTDPNDAGIILAGAQDNGTTLFKDNDWTHPYGNDGMECIVNYNNNNIMYASSQGGNIVKSIDGGGSFNTISNSIRNNFSDNGGWVTPFVLDPVDPNTIYVGYHNLYKSTNGGNIWNKISSFATPNNVKLNSVAVAPSDNNFIYASSGSTVRSNSPGSSIIYKTTDGGTSWINISFGLPTFNNTITYISVHDTDPNTLWVSFSGFSSGDKVYKSTDAGLNWTNISGNLPNIPVNCVIYEKGTNNGTYVGTDVGVYYKNDDLAIWQPFMTGLPNVIVTELEIHYASSKIRAATYGRGLWESNLFTNNNPPVAEFSASKTEICPETCTKFSNKTTNLGLQWQWYFPGGTPNTSTDVNPSVCYQAAGNYNVSLFVTNKNGTDSIYKQNYISAQTPTTGISTPLTEGFESTTSIPTDWSVINDDNNTTWTINKSVGGDGLSTSSFFIDNYSSPFIGKKDYLITPHVNFSNTTNPAMTFDVAYSQFSSNERSDTLAIYYSTDCGATKTLLWEKAGLNLATANKQPVLFVPEANEWRNETIDLNSLKGITAVDFYIENRSGFGNAIYLDNINIVSDITTNIKNNLLNDNDISLYPNPFENTLTIKSDDYNIKNVEIYNLIGEIVFSQQTNKKSNIHILNLDELNSGFYLIKMISDDKIITKNLIRR